MCDSEEGMARCSCLPAFVLSTDGKTCSPVHGSDAGEERFSRLIKWLQTEPSLMRWGCFSLRWGRRAGSLHQQDDFRYRSVWRNLVSPRSGASLMCSSLSDQSECHALRCDVNARCLQHADSASCWCLQGFTGDGHTCVGE